MKINKCIKSICLALCAIMLSLITMPTPIYASGCDNWYVMRTKDHSLPKLESRFEYIRKYNAYYADETAANNADKVIYLTFDAGYENGNIAKILDTLKKHGAVGAFFVLENLVKREPELIKRMANEGHLICNHTATHPDMTKLTDKDRFASQLSSLEATLKEVCGVECAKFYRPPQGKFNEENLKYASELGYKTVFWSFAYADWDNAKQPSAADATKKILDNIHCGQIMLLHPTSKTNADILDTVLTELSAQGYRFAPLTELK